MPENTPAPGQSDGAQSRAVDSPRDRYAVEHPHGNWHVEKDAFESLDLSTTEELVLEVLAARYRQGGKVWTFKTRCGTALRRLQDKGLVDAMHGVTEGTVRALLTNAGMAAVLSPSYVAPYEAQLSAILAETTRWQRDAQSPEERAWANVHHAAVTRAMTGATG